MPPAQDSLFLFPRRFFFFSVRSGMDVEDPGAGTAAPRRVLLSQGSSFFFGLPGLVRCLARAPRGGAFPPSPPLPSFSVPARRRRGSPAAGALDRSPLLVFLRRSRRPPPSKLRREAEYNASKACLFPRFFLFPLAWQDKTRLELALKARSVLRRSDVALFFPSG